MAKEFVNIAVYPKTREMIAELSEKSKYKKVQIVSDAIEFYAKKILTRVSALDKLR